MKRLILVSALLTTAFTLNTVWAADATMPANTKASAPTTIGKCNSKEAVMAADQHWANVLAQHDPKKVADLYEKDATLLGTFEDIPLLTFNQRVNYFKQLFEKIPNVKVTFNQQIVKLLKEDAISTGLYTFYGNGADGKAIAVPARYTFAYDSTPHGCVLIMHHSSVLPVEYRNINQIG